MQTRKELELVIEQSGLADKQAIVKTISPSILITSTRCDQDQIKTGQSRMGGEPDLPKNFVWPEWQIPADDSSYGWPDSNRTTPTALDFIAQINLSEIAGYPGSEKLPAHGFLYFFYLIESNAWGFNPRDKGSSSIVYFAGSSMELSRQKPPQNTTSLTLASSVSFETIWSIDDSLIVADEDFETYCELKEQLGPSDTETNHRLLGNCHTIQGPMKEDCEAMAALLHQGEKPKESWELLLQVDSDTNGPGWGWGDAGHIYFWISSSDLKSLLFDQHWLRYQCY